MDACRGILNGRPNAIVAYLPQASLNVGRWLAQTERGFRGLARVELIDTEQMELPGIEAVLRRATLVYIPGGNAFLLNHRLHTGRLAPYLREKIRHGLPVVAFSAGALVCGPNILTSNDLNLVPTAHFEALGILPYNLNVHYTDTAERDNWLAEYHSFHENAVLMLEDGAYVKTEGKTTTLVRGEAWTWRAGEVKQRLTPGETILPA
jgi:dipeptidase E